MTLDKLIETLELHCLAAVPVGSRVTVSPPPMDTDCDILCLTDGTPGHYDDFACWLVDDGWEEERGYGHTIFSSWRKKQGGIPYNIILTESEEWFDKFLEATVLCKKQNVQLKSDRFAIFNQVMKPKKLKFVASPAAVVQMQMWQQQQFEEAMLAAQPQYLIVDDVEPALIANPYGGGF